LASGKGSWEDIARFVVDSGTNAFVRNLVRGLADLYEMSEARITKENWEEVDEKIRKAHADPGWNGTVMDRAGIRAVVSDPYLDPLLDVRSALGGRYLSVLRINPFAVGWNPESLDHSGNSGHALLARLGLAPKSFDDYLAVLPKLLDHLPSLHKVGLKDALAYDRSVDFEVPDEKAARRAWGKSNPSPEERKAFGDLVVDRLCRLGAERDVPIQMHLGLGLIRGSRPLAAAALIERHPRTRFLLMHLGYPWSGELLGMALVYRNIWIDLTWSWLLSPTRFTHALREAIEVLPDESRMMLGGDNWHVEETYGAISGARRLIAGVLEQSVSSGEFHLSDAERLGRKILHDNADQFFRLGDG
jgi:hypothetical protein